MTNNKPQLKVNFSYTLDIDFYKLPQGFQSQYHSAKSIYDECGDTIELETFYDDLAQFVNDGDYDNFGALDLTNRIKTEVSEKGVKV
tara:strand:- start:162 stop:422 length:261 start_codon:yes stop_codon:yes gene_type:complete